MLVTVVVVDSVSVVIVMVVLLSVDSASIAVVVELVVVVVVAVLLYGASGVRLCAAAYASCCCRLAVAVVVLGPTLIPCCVRGRLHKVVGLDWSTTCYLIHVGIAVLSACCLLSDPDLFNCTYCRAIVNAYLCLPVSLRIDIVGEPFVAPRTCIVLHLLSDGVAFSMLFHFVYR